MKQKSLETHVSCSVFPKILVTLRGNFQPLLENLGGKKSEIYQQILKCY